jgi:hypothetical protein
MDLATGELGPSNLTLGGAVMGIWSSIKKAVKKVVRAVKAVVRVVVKIVATIVMGVINVFDLLLGFLTWPEKKLTLYVLVLSKLTDAQRKQVEGDLQASIQEVRRIFKDRFNVKIRPYGSNYVEFFQGTAPTEALNPSCCGGEPFGEEFGIRGDFYASHVAGWVGIPISFRFPVTVFVVDDVKCKAGCSLGPLADYVVVQWDGLNNAGEALPNSLIAHEIGHACNLPHAGSSQPYLMWGPSNRGDKVHGWQKNLFRSSRHVTYW